MGALASFLCAQPSREPYSPDCLEVEFCEVRGHRVLRSSALALCSGVHNSPSHRSMVQRLYAGASAPRERQTRCKAGAQSLRASLMREVAGLPNGGGVTIRRVP